MSDNFWFNENAFLNSSGGGKGNDNDDFLDIFDPAGGATGSASGASTGNGANGPLANQNQNQNQSQPVNMSQGTNQPAPMAQNLNPQMFLRQAQQQYSQSNQQVNPNIQQNQFNQNVNQSHPGMSHNNSGMNQSNPALNQNNKEQLLKMRQQIMQQQMLQRQQQQQQQNMNLVNNNSNMSPQAQAQASMRLKNIELENLPGSPGLQLGTSIGSMNQGTPNMGINHDSYSASPIMMNGQSQMMQQLVQPQMQQPPQMQQQQQPQPQPQQPIQSQQGQPMQQQQQPQFNKLPSAQVAQLQIELFFTTLYDFMTRRGTPISQPPVINGKRVNLFFFQLLTQKLGGPAQLIKWILQPNFNHQQLPWFLIGQKFALYDGINVQDPSAREHIDREIINCYTTYLLPYEEYNSTPDGNKDLQLRRAVFQKQLLLRFQQSQQSSPLNLSPQMGVPSPMNSQPTPGVVPQQSPVISQAPTPQQRKYSRVSNPSNQNSPNPIQSPHIQGKQAPVAAPGPNFNQRQMSQIYARDQMNRDEKAQIMAREQEKAQAKARSMQRVQQQASTPQSQQGQPQNSQFQQPTPQIQPTSRTSLAADVKAPTPKPAEADEEPNIIKNYVPFRKVVDTHGGFAIKELSQVASEIEITKPVYLFAPELGSINMHALIMALKNYSGPNSGEIFTSLNTLLVTTSDANYAFRIDHCLELLESLSTLGIKILNNIVRTYEGSPFAHEDVTKLGGNHTIDEVFSKYNQSTGLMAEDVSYVVDSLTGEVLDEDMDVDDLFDVVTENSSAVSTPHDTSEDYNFHISDYITTLQSFREENKHHFSKIQTKSANDDQIMMVDQLITVTMILRNISFADVNKVSMAANESFKNLIFAIVKNIGLHGDKFVFHRKRLCLLKDCLLMLNNISFFMELRSLEEAFLAFVLVASFGSPPKDDYEIPQTVLETHTCLAFGIDAFTKLIVREPHNRSLVQAVLNGTLNINSSATYSNMNPFVITQKDQAKTKRLALSYLDGNESAFKEGILLTRSFQLFMSILPYDANSYDFSKFIFARAPTISQTLFGAKLLIDMVPTEDGTTALNQLSVRWLVANRRILLSNLSRVTVALVSETGKFGRDTQEFRILTLVLTKSMIVINTLVGNAVALRDLIPGDAFVDEIAQIGDLSRISPDPNVTLDTYMAPTVDTNLGKEVVRLLGLVRVLSGPANVVDNAVAGGDI